jgi:hypothetical protein
MKFQKSLPKLIRLLGLPLLSIPIALSVAQAQVSQPAPVNRPPAEAIEPQPTLPEVKSDIGIEFEGFRELNTARVIATEFVGECPGNAIRPLNARFISSTTPPAPGLRVVVRNITRGMGGDIAPYTDREYNDGQRSEGFIVLPSTRHNGRYLAVLEGINDFEYQIKRNGAIIESGTFSVEIEQRTRTIARDAQIVYEEYCVRSLAISDCKSKDRRVRLVRRCPGEPGYNRIFAW